MSDVNTPAYNTEERKISKVIRLINIECDLIATSYDFDLSEQLNLCNF